MEWRERVDRLLYDGETVAERLEVADAEVVVTSHRVLAFTPEAEGADFRQVDRPNVGDVTVTAEGTPGHLLRAGKVGLVGAVLLAAAFTVSFGTLIPSVDTTATADAPGAGGIVESIELVMRMLALLDVLVLVGGLLATAVALAFVGLYLRSRTRRLVLEVAGEDDIAIPVEGSVTVAEDLEAAIAPDPVAERDDEPRTEPTADE